LGRFRLAAHCALLNGALMSEGDKIVAVGLMTEADMKCWGHKLRRLYKAEASPNFDDLLRAIDSASLDNGNPTSKS
jgi:hypothetical protein